MAADHEKKTLNEFLLGKVRRRSKKCSHSHTPNQETLAALKSAKKKENIIDFDSIEKFFKTLGK